MADGDQDGSEMNPERDDPPTGADDGGHASRRGEDRSEGNPGRGDGGGEDREGDREGRGRENEAAASGGQDGEKGEGDDEGKDPEEGGDGDDDDGKEDAEGDDGDGEDKPSPLSKPWVRLALVLGAALAVVLLLVWYLNYRSYGRYQQSTNDAYLAADQVNVAPRIAGYVERVLVEDNEVVKAGQILVVIDRRTADANAAQSRAQIAEAEATVAQARATRRQQFDAIRQALSDARQSRAGVAQQVASERFNADQVARYAPLSAAGVETKERLSQNRSNLDQSRAQLASARAQLASSMAQVASARHQIGVVDAQIRSGLAQVASARARLAASQVDVGAAVVRSRIGGRIGDRTVRVGQYVQVGTRMMTVVPVDRIYLTANFKETQIGLMRVGQTATIEVDALPGEEIHGVVESFSPGTGSRFAQVPVDNATGNFTKIVQRVPVRIRVDAGPEARRVLVPGLSVTVSVDTRGAKRDREEVEEEGERLEKGRERQSEAELERDRRRDLPGAGQ